MSGLDVTARGLARQALQTDATQASPSGASSIGTADGGNVQMALDKVSGRTIAEAAATDIDATGDVEQVRITGRGIYRKSTAAPTQTEIDREFAFTDAGGTIWAKPADRICRASEYGIVAHESFDEDGLLIGTPVDQAPLMQDLLYRIQQQGGGVLRFDGQRGAIALGSSVIVPFGVDLDGVTASLTPWGGDYRRSLRFMPTAEGQFFDSSGTLRSMATDGDCQQGILFWANIDPANPNTWMQEFPGTDSGTFRNLSIDGQMTNGIKGIRFAGSYRFTDLRGFLVGTLIEKPNLYTDQVLIESISASYRANDTDYLIDLPGLGDGCFIRSVAAGYLDDQTGITRGIYLGLARGGVIEGVINGIDMIAGASGIEYRGAHKEGGQIIVDGAEVAIRSGHFHNGENHLTPIVLMNSLGIHRNSSRVTVEDCGFVHHVNPTGGGGSGWSGTEIMDIDLQSDRIQLCMNGGNRRLASVSGQVDRRLQHAPLIGDSTGGGVFATWRNYAPMLATQPTSLFARTVSVSGKTPNRLANWNGLSADGFTPLPGVPGVAFKGDTATYFYFARPLYDPVRMLGRAAAGNAEVSVDAVRDSSTLPAFDINAATTATRGAVTWEVYRGIASGIYDRRVLIPGIDLDMFIDDGNALNGFAWILRTPGPPADINNNGHAGTCEYSDGILRIVNGLAATPPTKGTFSVGDTIVLPSQTVDASAMKLASYTCRAAGTPGVWDPQYASTTSPAQ
jgi:hypothetical protein